MWTGPGLYMETVLIVAFILDYVLQESSPICINELNGALWLIHVLLACGATLQ
jgi:hypothetical protein